MTAPRLTPRAWLLLIALSLLWGSSFLTTTDLVETMAPLHVITHRVLWAALVACGYVAIRRFPLPRDPATLAALVLMGIGNNALPFALQAWAQQTIESGLAGILNATTAIFGVIVAAIFLADEKLTPAKAIGVVLGFAGVALVIGPGALRHFDLRSTAQLAMLASTLSYALSSVLARKRLAHLRPEMAAAGMLAASALIMVPLSWAIDGPLPLALAPAMLVEIGYYSLFVTAFAYLLYYALIRTAGAANTMLVTLIIVPTAVVLGAVVRAEALPLTAYLGFLLIAAGLAAIDGRLLGRAGAARAD